MSPTDPKWRRRFLDLAGEVAGWSKDTTQVGCVIVSPDGLVISTGYNGIPRGVRDLAERMQRPAKYFWTVHGEEAAIANAARHGSKTSGATLYCTHAPCSRCARQIINAGIVEVVCDDGRTAMPADEFATAGLMFLEAGVRVMRHHGSGDWSIENISPPQDDVAA
ncbi:deoxycytidylate deaminase [Methylobacterium sp. D53M]